MYCIFLSDAHLKGRDDKNQEKVVQFLEGIIKEHPDMVFLLGDIFDYWVNPGGLIDPVYVPLMDVLRRLSESNVKIYYHIGNHDFFVKNTFEKMFNTMEIIENGMVIELDGSRCFVTHGDMIDYTDKWYRVLRFIIRSRFSSAIADILPASITRRIASRLSQHSREVWTIKRTMPNHVIDEFVEKKAVQGFDVVIAAHFHIPEIREYIIQDRKIRYINTGNWFNAYSYVVFKDGQFDLRYYGKSV